MIKEDYVSFEIAKLLKEKGFREWCDMCYSPSLYYNGDILDVDEESELKASGEWDETKARWIHTLYSFNCNNEQYEGVYAAPTLQMAMKWLREVHNIFVNIDYSHICEQFKYTICLKDSSLRERDAHVDYIYKTYEEACEAAIKYCLEFLI